jgi:hypothetical protein
MVKKVFAFLLAASMLFTLTGCSDWVGGLAFLAAVLMSDDRADKDEVFAFVQENEAALLKAIEDKDFSDYENKGFIKKIDSDIHVVDFSCGGAGVGSGTSYVGFFYTAADDMADVWCAPYSEASLEPSGSGFAWQEENGDNRYYTEHICGHFYYYEASF